MIRLEKNFGKGGAIEFGIENTKGEILSFLDADGSISKDEVQNCIEYFFSHPEIDLLISSRIKMLGKRIQRSLKRHLSGRIFITIFNYLFNVPAYDTQCGFKIFKKEKYNLVKELILNKSWTWDTELIILFYLKKFNIIEYPISWHDEAGSKVSLFKDSFRMFFSLIKFKSHLKEKKLIK